MDEPKIRVGLGGIQAFVQVDISASAAVHESVELFASPALKLMIPGLLDVGAGAAVALDLVIGVDAAIDLSAGVYISFGADAYVDISLLTKDIVDVSLTGLVAKALPLGIGADVDLSAEVALQLGLRLRTEIDLKADLDIPVLEIEAGAKIAIWISLFDYTAILINTPDCIVSVSEVIALTLGLAVELNVEVGDILDLSLAPSLTVTLGTAANVELCLPDRGVPGVFIERFDRPGTATVSVTSVSTTTGFASASADPTTTGSASADIVPTASGSASDSVSDATISTASGSTSADSDATTTGSASADADPTTTGSASVDIVPTASGSASDSASDATIPTISGSVSNSEAVPTASGSDSGSEYAVPTASDDDSVTSVPTASGSTPVAAIPKASGDGSITTTPAASDAMAATTLRPITTPAVVHGNSSAVGYDGGDITSTVTSTHVYTITSCAASVVNCPARYTQKVITSTVVSSTYICPAGSSGAVSESASASHSSSTPVSVTTVTDTLVTIVPCSERSTKTFHAPTNSPPPAPTVTIVDRTTICPATEEITQSTATSCATSGLQTLTSVASTTLVPQVSSSSAPGYEYSVPEASTGIQTVPVPTASAPFPAYNGTVSTSKPIPGAPEPTGSFTVPAIYSAPSAIPSVISTPSTAPVPTTVPPASSGNIMRGSLMMALPLVLALLA